MSVTRAMQKIAEPDEGWASRCVVCHRCGAESAVPSSARLDETVCVSCIEPLEACVGAPRAIDTVTSWSDKAAVSGPGYGIVECPHCAARCVVEIGAAPRTGCPSCVRPLGSQPLLRLDVGATHPGPPTPAWDDGDEDEDRVGRCAVSVDYCMRLSG